MSPIEIEEMQLTRDEVIAYMEREAKARRQISAAELVRAYREGKLHEPCEVMDILGYGFLLAPDDPLYVALGR